MGSVSFQILSIGRFKNPNQAYNFECQEAEYYQGHDPYNGSISTTTSYYRESNAPRFGTRKFYGFIGKQLDSMGKRECHFVELEGAALKKAKEKHGYKGKRNIKAFYFYGIAAC